MNVFEPAFCQEYGVRSAQLLRRFDSKKNEVALFSFQTAADRKTWIVKKFSEPDRCQREAEILTVLHAAGVAVPKIIYRAKDHLVLTYIQGLTFLEWLEKAEKEHLPRREYVSYLRAFACWVDFFYRATAQSFSPGLILGDVNLRNFILGERFFGLDFEDCRPGCPAEDLGRFCAYILSYDPAFTRWKYQFVAAVKEEVGPRLNLPWRPVLWELQKELECMGRRRQNKNLLAEFHRHERVFNLIE